MTTSNSRVFVLYGINVGWKEDSGNSGNYGFCRCGKYGGDSGSQFNSGGGRDLLFESNFQDEQDKRNVLHLSHFSISIYS